MVPHDTRSSTLSREGGGSGRRPGVLPLARPSSRHPEQLIVLFDDVEDQLEDYGPILVLGARVVDHRDELIVQIVHVVVGQFLTIRADFVANLKVMARD